MQNRNKASDVKILYLVPHLTYSENSIAIVVLPCMLHK